MTTIKRIPTGTWRMASVLDALEEEITCGICFQSQELRELPCQHSYCPECINQMKNFFFKRITCPECRETHKLPKKKGEGFPRNRLAQRLNERIEQLKSSAELSQTLQVIDDPGDVIQLKSTSTAAPSSRSEEETPVRILNPCKLTKHSGPPAEAGLICLYCSNLLCLGCAKNTQCANHRPHNHRVLKDAVAEARTKIRKWHEESKRQLGNSRAVVVEHETHISRLLSEQHAAEEQLRVARQVVNQHEEQMTHLLSTLNLPEVDIIKQCQKIQLAPRPAVLQRVHTRPRQPVMPSLLSFFDFVVSMISGCIMFFYRLAWPRTQQRTVQNIITEGIRLFYLWFGCSAILIVLVLYISVRMGIEFFSWVSWLNGFN